jgi:hypothetical protein
VLLVPGFRLSRWRWSEVAAPAPIHPTPSGTVVAGLARVEPDRLRIDRTWSVTLETVLAPWT